MSWKDKLPGAISLFFACWILLCTFSPLNAQWSASEDGGVLITEHALRTVILPDGDGGAWVGFNIYDYSNDIYRVFARVQRIDNEGNLLFREGGITMSADSTEREFYLTGMQPSHDGGVVVILNGYEVPPDTLWHMYGQRITAAGERVWDQPVQASDSLHDAFENTSRHVTASDSAGGFWTVYNPFMSSGLYVCGLNADGTRKLTSDISMGATSDPVSICADEVGGVILTWQAGNGSEYNQVSFDGINRYVTPLQFSLISTPMMVMPDHNGGFYCMMTNNVYTWITRVLENGTNWGELGRPLMIKRGSDILETENGSVAVIGRTAAVQGYSAYLGRVNPDGTSFYEGFTMVVDSSDINGFNSNPTPLLVDDQVGGMFGFVGWDDFGSEMEGIRAYRISEDGTVLWGQEPTPIFITYTPHNEPQGTYLKGVPIVSDSSVILVVGQSGSNPEFQNTRTLYKVLPEGSIAGRVADVPRENNEVSDIPADFALLSLFPTPTNHAVKMRVHIGEQGEYSYRVLNILGRVVHESSAWYQPGDHTVTWSGNESLSAGSYFIQWFTESEILLSQKVVLVK